MLTMPRQRKTVGVVLAAALAAMLAMLALTSSATAKLTGEFTKFQFCPVSNPEATRCLHSVTEGGEVTLGTKTVPIVNPTTLQGGTTEAGEDGFATFLAATNGVTLSKTPQPVPGGLLGLVPPESSPPLVKELLKFATENGLTGVNSTLEIAGPVSGIKVSETRLAEGLGVAIILPIKVRLENPVLGNNCYVGSDSAPIFWNLTTGKTAPPPPNESISGNPGEVEFLEEGRVLGLSGTKLVDNAWSAPAAKGCGGFLSLLIDPIINLASGLPAKAGVNTAILENTIRVTTPAGVIANDEENP
jgi:hypothetical protein